MLLVGTLIGGVWFGLLVAGHAATLTLWPQQHRSRTLLRLVGLVALGALSTAALVPLDLIPAVAPTSHRIVAATAAVVTVGCCLLLYMPAYYTVVSSLSGQLLVKLDDAPDGKLPLHDLASADTYGRIVGPRLDSMVASGLLARQGGAYRATPKGHRTARLFLFLKGLWQLGPGG